MILAGRVCWRRRRVDGADVRRSQRLKKSVEMIISIVIGPGAGAEKPGTEAAWHSIGCR